MDQCIEQTVSGDASGTGRLFASVLGVLSVLLLIGGAACAAAVVSESFEGKIEINWPALAGVALCLFVACFSWRQKDKLCVEYDYSVCGNELSVSVIYNERRRKRLLCVNIVGAQDFGFVDSDAYRALLRRSDVPKRKWYLHADRPLYYLLYETNGRQSVAVLELDARLREAIQRNRRFSAQYRNI